jgi:hypothetical protein
MVNVRWSGQIKHRVLRDEYLVDSTSVASVRTALRLLGTSVSQGDWLHGPGAASHQVNCQRQLNSPNPRFFLNFTQRATQHLSHILSKTRSILKSPLQSNMPNGFPC